MRIDLFKSNHYPLHIDLALKVARRLMDAVLGSSFTISIARTCFAKLLSARWCGLCKALMCRTKVIMLPNVFTTYED